MPELNITRTTPVYAPIGNAGVFVQWDINMRNGGLPASLPAPLGGPTIVFEVGRSQSPRGPFVTVASNLTVPYFYDPHVPALSGAIEAWELRTLEQQTYYCVRAYDMEAPSPYDVAIAQDVAPVGDELPRKIQLMRAKMQRDFALQLKVGAGIPIAVLKLKHWGPRCTRCFDRLTKSVLDQDCAVCFSTGFVGGYYEPVVIRARKGVTAVATTLQSTGNVDVNAMPYWMLDYPLFSREDILVELHTGRRYEIERVTRTELRGVPVHQRVETSELARDNTVYRVPVPTGTTPSFGV